MNIDILPATEADLAEACALYNEYAVSSVATFDLAPRDMTTFAAGYLKTPNFGCVARDEAGALAGFVSMGPFIHRAAAAQSVEIALYLRADRCGGGLGPRLLEAGHAEARDRRIATIIAVITTENVGSCAFFEREGYVYAGALSRIARKGGQELGVSYYQYLL